MHNKRSFIVFVILIIMIQSPTSLAFYPPYFVNKPAAVPNSSLPSSRTPSFYENFSGPSLDLRKWNTSYWWGRTHDDNNELEYFTDDSLSIRNGALHITARKQDTPFNGKIYPYTSGVITTEGKFAQQYGYFEMEATLPKGKGLWPAFWLLPTDHSWPPEIDIMEVLGHEPNILHANLHTPDPIKGDLSTGSKIITTDLSIGKHTYGVDWRPNSITWYLDGQPYFQVTDPAKIPHKPMYIIANLAVGGNWPGAPDETTPFPNVFKIYSIKAFPRELH